MEYLRRIAVEWQCSETGSVEMIRRLPLQAPQRQPEPSPELEAEHAGDEEGSHAAHESRFTQAMETKFVGKFSPDQEHITRLFKSLERHIEVTVVSPIHCRRRHSRTEVGECLLFCRIDLFCSGFARNARGSAAPLVRA